MESDTPPPADIFTCRMCGDCCRGYGGTYLSENDITAISEYVGMEPAQFVETCCRMSGGRPVLAQSGSGYCLFWDRVCTIHAVKPSMCRSWPYIRSVLADVANWHSMASCCPGIRTDVPDEVILAEVRRRCGDGG